MKNIKTLILDTTYILPLFGIKIIELSNFREVSKKLFGGKFKQFDLFLPSNCLEEVLFKLVSLYKKDKDLRILNRYSATLPSLLSFNSLKIFNPLTNSNASLIATKIRYAGDTDLMDCLIAATAVVLKGILLTQDNELGKIIEEIPETKDLII